MVSALFDVGGTHTRLAFNDDQRLCGTVKVDTDSDANPLEWLAELIAQHAQTDSLERVVLALPGSIADGTLHSAPNLPQWSDIDFSELAQQLGVEVELINDADAAALGEAHFGVGQDLGRFGYITISTGIGGALINHGHLEDNDIGFEPGRQIIDWRAGESLEGMAGGASVEQRLGTKLGQLTDESSLNPVVRQLATGIFNTAIMWTCRNLVLNGPALFESESLLSRLQSTLDEILRQRDSGLGLTLHRSELADDAGLYGCLALATDGNELV